MILSKIVQKEKRVEIAAHKTLVKRVKINKKERISLINRRKRIKRPLILNNNLRNYQKIITTKSIKRNQNSKIVTKVVLTRTLKSQVLSNKAKNKKNLR